KGAVENLVGFVKRSLFSARRVQDLERDLPEQLAAWLVEVNTVRPCRATREIPAARLPAGQARLKPLPVAPAGCGRPRPRAPAPRGGHAQAALLHARAAARAGPGRGGVSHRAGPPAALYLEGGRRAALRAARGTGRSAHAHRAAACPVPAPDGGGGRRAARRPPRRRGVMTRPTRSRRRAPRPPTEPARDLDGMLRRLHLPTIRRLYGDLATRAEADGMGYRVYLETLIAEEVAHRTETRLTRAVHKARFPFLRTIDD